MSNTINIGGIEVSKFYLGGSSDVKIYIGTTKLYPHLQEPCFAVVADISQYSDRTYVDVYNQADDKWYKLNNLNQYEEYGIYGSGRTITTYDGKLTVDDGYEYMYSGGSWVNVGEVSGSTASLPDISFSLNYNAKQYDSTNRKIPQTSGQLQNVDAVCNYGYKIVDHSADGYISITGNSRFICSGNSGTYLNRTNTQTGCTMTIVSKAKTTSGYSILTNRQGNGTTYLNWMYRQYTDGYMKLHGKTDTQQIACSTTEPNILSVRTLYNGGVKSYMNNWSLGTSTSQDTFAYLNTGTRGGALFCDYSDVNNEFWRGDFYWVYMSQNVLTDEQIQQVIDYNESSGGTVEYPIYYDEMQDPPNNLTFSSMTEAEEYECPYVGLIAAIDGVKYIFSGDSTSGYEWVLYSRLPSAYTEVEYVENTGSSSVNLGVQLLSAQGNTFEVVFDHEMTWTSGGENLQTFLTDQKEVSPYPGWSYRFNNSGVVEFSHGLSTALTTGRTLVSGSTYHMVITCTGVPNDSVHNYPLNLFSSLDSTQTPFRFCKGKLYNMTVKFNNNLVRDLVPCYRKSDNVAGLYDLVNNVFYSSASGYDQLVVGNLV